MKSIYVTFLLIGIVLLTSLITVQAQSNPYELTWFILSTGGGMVAGGEYQLHGTAGQPDAGVVLSGGGFTLDGGWQTGEVARHEIFLPLVNR